MERALSIRLLALQRANLTYRERAFQRHVKSREDSWRGTNYHAHGTHL